MKLKDPCGFTGKEYKVGQKIRLNLKRIDFNIKRNLFTITEVDQTSMGYYFAQVKGLYASIPFEWIIPYIK